MSDKKPMGQVIQIRRSTFATILAREFWDREVPKIAAHPSKTFG